MLEGHKEIQTSEWSHVENNWNARWKPTFQGLAESAMSAADPGHGIDHIVRVVANATNVGQRESLGSDLPNVEIVFPAAWLHDCVLIPKNSPDRSKASLLAADHAMELLKDIEYPNSCFDRIHHAILSHSFSARIPCETIEAKIVQDADRLEALGAIGIARCLMTGGHLGIELYDIAEPFPFSRSPDDRRFSIDHFFSKLFRLPSTMNTEAGRAIANQRLSIMKDFLHSLGEEIGCDSVLLSQLQAI